MYFLECPFWYEGSVVSDLEVATVSTERKHMWQSLGWLNGLEKMQLIYQYLRTSIHFGVYGGVFLLTFCVN